MGAHELEKIKWALSSKKRSSAYGKVGTRVVNARKGYRSVGLGLKMNGGQ